MTSFSVFAGALAGRRLKYAARSRLNSWWRIEELLAAFGDGTVTVVAPSAWMTATAAVYCALVEAMTPIRLPASASVLRPAR